MARRRAQIALILTFLVVLIELCRQFATRGYSPFGLWPQPEPDFTMYGGAAFLGCLLVLLWLVRRRET